VTRPRPVADAEAGRARALADPTRRAVLALIERSAGGIGVRDLAERLCIHVNSARQHAGVLRDCGLVAERVERSGRPGRPHLLYERVPAVAGGDGRFERLTFLLAQVAEGRAVEDVAGDEARRLARDHEDRDGVALVAAVAADQGFAPRVDAGTSSITLERCPYASVAGPAVCALHRSIVGALARDAGGALDTFSVAPNPGDGCQLTLTTREDPR
jgi:predicted ArsR family transcriptional regulator